MTSKQLIDSINNIGEQLIVVKEHQDKLVKALLSIFGIPKTDLDKYITGNYQCIFYLPQVIDNALEDRIKKVFPSNIIFYKESNGGKEYLDIELYKIIDKNPVTDIYRLSLTDLNFLKYVKDYIKGEDNTERLIEVEKQLTSQPCDMVLAMAMALQHGEFKEPNI